MKESYKSIRLLFLVFGGFSILGLVSSTNNFSNLSALDITTSLIAGVFGLFYLYFGIRLRELLPDRKKLIQSVIVLEGIYVVAVSLFVIFVVATLDDVPTSLKVSISLFGLVVTLAINTYLYISVGKISNRIEQGVEDTEGEMKITE